MSEFKSTAEVGQPDGTKITAQWERPPKPYPTIDAEPITSARGPEPADAAPVIELPTKLGLTELQVAEDFLWKHSANYKWCKKRGSWYAWTGSRWELDTRECAFGAVKRLVKETAVKTDHPHFEKLAFIAAVETLARRDFRAAIDITAFDRDPWLLNTPGGTVDLKTGQLREARREDMCSRQTTVAPAEPGTDAPRWRRFLREITEGDLEMEAYLQRIAGYTLTGDTSEQVLFCLYGMGSNGKGTFANLLYWLLGDYATVMSSTTLIAQKFEAHPTEIAKLAGCRLALASEVDPGQRWALARLKRLTGEDPLCGHFMRQDDFEFTMEGKLWFLVNTQPDIIDVDDAVKRRFQMAPFTARFEGGTRDNSLRAALQAEGPAILRWMLDGCAEWRRIGLAPPERVRAASREYMEGEDDFGEFLASTFVVAKDGKVTKAEAFARWVAHCRAGREEPGTKNAFGKRLRKRYASKVRDREGDKPAKDSDGKHCYLGLALLPGLEPVTRSG